MIGRYGATAVAVFASVCLVSSTAAGQTRTGDADGWTPPRTADGQPDLQGKWTLATFTPLERPDRFGDREFLTEEEAAELLNLLTASGTNPLARSVFGEEDPDLRNGVDSCFNRQLNLAGQRSAHRSPGRLDACAGGTRGPSPGEVHACWQNHLETAVS